MHNWGLILLLTCCLASCTSKTDKALKLVAELITAEYPTFSCEQITEAVLDSAYALPEYNHELWTVAAHAVKEFAECDTIAVFRQEELNYIDEWKSFGGMGYEWMEIYEGMMAWCKQWTDGLEKVYTNYLSDLKKIRQVATEGDGDFSGWKLAAKYTAKDENGCEKEFSKLFFFDTKVKSILDVIDLNDEELKSEMDLIAKYSTMTEDEFAKIHFNADERMAAMHKSAWQYYSKLKEKDKKALRERCMKKNHIRNPWDYDRDDEPEIENPDISNVRTFAGTIAGAPVHMSLYVDDAIVTVCGRYYYDKQRAGGNTASLRVYGSKSDISYSLTEYSTKGARIGTLTGELKDGKFSGTYTRMKDYKEFDFSLDETSEQTSFVLDDLVFRKPTESY